MPLFDFVCQDCGKEAEYLVASSDEVPKCNECEGSELKKKLSAHSSLSGVSNLVKQCGDVPHCGINPGGSDCPGPGSCCGGH